VGGRRFDPAEDRAVAILRELETHRTDEPRIAEPHERLLARIIDFWIGMVGLYVLWLVGGFFAEADLRANPLGPGEPFRDHTDLGNALGFAALGLALAYELVPAMLGRQTFSRARIRLQVVDISGRPASRRQLVVRALALTVPWLTAFALTAGSFGTMWSLVPFAIMLGIPASLYLTMSRSPEHQGWHDRIAGTKVVTPR